MGYKALNRQEAVDLITPIVDGEASQREEEAFFFYAQKNPSILKLLEQERRLKKYLQAHYQCAAAPPHLKNWVQDNLYSPAESERTTHGQTARPAQQTESVTIHPIPIVNFNQRTWVYTSLSAAILLIVFYGGMVLWNSNSTKLNWPGSDHSSLAYQTYSFYSTNAGQPLTPTLATTKRQRAMRWLEENLHLSVHIPNIDGAEFCGVVLSEITADYITPLLEYETSEQNYIYLFVFDEQQLIKNGTLARNPDAISTCVTNGDYYIENVKGTHVVSWKWKNHWYSAISNYNGDHLARRVLPLREKENY